MIIRRGFLARDKRTGGFGVGPKNLGICERIKPNLGQSFCIKRVFTPAERSDKVAPAENIKSCSRRSVSSGKNTNNIMQMFSLPLAVRFLSVNTRHQLESGILGIFCVSRAGNCISESCVYVTRQTLTICVQNS